MNIIVAVDKNFGIGKGNELLAHIKPDLKYFKKITDGNIVVMGYNTYLSLPNGPLPNRTNIVITRKDIEINGAIVVHSLEELTEKLRSINTDKDVFIIGGASIYKQMLPFCEKLYITHIFHEFEADVFFPKLGEEWEIETTYCTKENIEHKYPHVFMIYKRKNI